MTKNKYKHDLICDKLAGILAGIHNGDYCYGCWKFQLPYFLRKFLCGNCNAFSGVINSLSYVLDEEDSENTIDELLNRLIDLEEENNKYKNIIMKLAKVIAKYSKCEEYLLSGGLTEAIDEMYYLIPAEMLNKEGNNE